MAKYRIVSKGNLVTVRSKLVRGEQINEREILFFESQLFRGFFRPSMEKKRVILYTAPEVVEIQQYLKNTVKMDCLYELVAQILEVVKRIEISGLYLGNLVLDINLIFISERTKELFFIYQPLVSKFAYGNVYGFIEKLVQVVKIEEADVSEMDRFKSVIADKRHYKIEDIEAYIRNVYPLVYQKIISADAGKSGFITNDRIEYKKHYRQNDVDESGTTLLEEGNEGTTLLGQDEGTVLLMQEVPKLIRIKTQEEILLDKENFLLGTDCTCDYIVVDNRAVSRKHAEIRKIRTGYYIVDKNSTNHTYVEGHLIESDTPYEIVDGAKIQIANEEFEFTW